MPTADAYEIEKKVTAALASALTLTGLPVYTRFTDAEDMPIERIEAGANTFVQASDQMGFVGTTPFYCHFAGQIEVFIQTRRKGQTNTTHDAALSRVRYILSRPAQAINPTGLEVLRLTPSGATPSVQDDDGADITGLTYQVEVAVLPSAFSP